jgi:hypothetical protein
MTPASSGPTTVAKLHSTCDSAVAAGICRAGMSRGITERRAGLSTANSAAWQKIST